MSSIPHKKKSSIPHKRKNLVSKRSTTTTKTSYKIHLLWKKRIQNSQIVRKKDTVSKRSTAVIKHLTKKKVYTRRNTKGHQMSLRNTKRCQETPPVYYYPTQSRTESMYQAIHPVTCTEGIFLSPLSVTVTLLRETSTLPLSTKHLLSSSCCLSVSQRKKNPPSQINKSNKSLRESAPRTGHKKWSQELARSSIAGNQ